MAELRSGIFNINEFEGRNLLKLAPDAFVTVNGSLASKVIAPVEGLKNFSLQGGITNINVNAAAYPPGASQASIEIIAPQYRGLHEDYYVTAPSGVKIPVFTPLMEIKVYMKGRFMDNGKPVYYPVFWGMVLTISESYSGGVHSFSLDCGDVLTWWKYQKITLVPSVVSSLYGAPIAKRFPTVFKNMNPWEIVYSLLSDTGFVDDTGKTYNFIYPQLSNIFDSPSFGNLSREQASALLGGFIKDATSYWNARFGFGLSSLNSNTQGERIPIEMYGLRGPISVNSISESVRNFDQISRAERRSSLKAELDIDFNILSRVQPYGGFDLFGNGDQPLSATKLEIVNNVIDQVHFELFVDTNGKIVFKPPFYNLDVRNDAYPTYTVEPQDIINFSSSVISDNIRNYVECTSPKRYDVAMENIGYYIDFDLIKQFGIRFEHVDVRYGNDANSLFLIAAAEAAKINGKAFTGSLSIPLRPEIRLGYPVYIRHIDAYYYVNSITHSFTYGSAAQTDIGLEFRRDRVYDPEGDITNSKGAVLDGYVYRFRPEIADNVGEKENAGDPSLDLPKDLELLRNDIAMDNSLRLNNILAGPKSNGFFEISKAKRGRSAIENSSTTEAVISNELLMITDETTPYTDQNGFRHIGAFPYGANLRISSNGDSIFETLNQRDQILERTNVLSNASPYSGEQTNTSFPIPSSSNNTEESLLKEDNQETLDNAPKRYNAKKEERRKSVENNDKRKAPTTVDLNTSNPYYRQKIENKNKKTLNEKTNSLIDASAGESNYG